MRNIKLLILLAFALPTLIGCGESKHFPEKLNDDDVSLAVKTLDFYNLSDEYDIEAEFFDLYYPDGSDVPYIAINDFIYGLEGLFDCGDKLTSTYSDKAITYNFAYSSDYSYSMEVNWYKDTITLSSIDFPAAITKDTGSTDYSAHFKFINGYQTSDNPITFNLDKYYFEILNYRNTCMVPLVIAGMILSSPNYYNIIYNGDEIYGYFGEVDYQDPTYQTMYESSLNNTQCSSAMRKASFYSLCFAMDYYYGLKDERVISSFESYLSYSLKNQIYSTDPLTTLDGYINSLVYKLDDLHSRVDSGSIYNKVSDVPTLSFNKLGSHWRTFYDTRNTLNGYKKQVWTTTEPEVRFVDNCAIIYLSSFKTGTHDEIYDEQGKVKSDAWKYDTYWFMHYVMDQITAKRNIDNILIDVSVNGGGNVGAMIRALGFLTNQNIRYTMYDTLVQRGSIYFYDVDVTGDDSYKSHDAYTQYKWTLLTSESSFSAANTFTSIFKELNIGKTIGHKSGGGMCSVLPIILADGTAIAISSHNSIRQYKESTFSYDFVSIENGISVDYEFSYDKFYSDSYLCEVLNQL